MDADKKTREVGTVLLLTFVSFTTAVQDSGDMTTEERERVIQNQAKLFLGLLNGFGYAVTEKETD